ncbi:Swt1 family HEPN domain-containing protein [Corynebacterium sputi]|uniref:Swt1 family HEPN domain-containing protein n=1 Tax=Corynebacterium sputi TaxID=489915 RepID=UPI00042A7848|nr:Swt1 family HEPN domain-containing protein [Corynebacterium sputi]
MSAHISISETLQFLAERLDPIIQDRLEPDLGGIEWTVVLTEIDRAKGRTPRNYSRTDLQSQLRILTERLGSLGFPFDDHLRTVSTLGGELRIMRNRWAHNDPLTNLDAVRTADFAARLLKVFSDVDGAEYCRQLHDQAFLVYAEAKDLITFESDDTQPAPELIQDENTELDQSDCEESTGPDEEEMSRGGLAADTPTIGDGRFSFDPWTLVVAGDKSVLDELPKKAAKMQVRAVAAEIAEFEGPIHIERLIRLTARSFEMNRVSKAKSAQLRRQLKQLDLLVDEDGFIWPSDIDPDNWDEFRPNDSSVNRPFTDISPVEIANAYRSIAARRPDLDDDDLDSAVLRTFGRKRKTRECAAHLDRARVDATA